jgi:Xaa-Pro aminopeptidase
MTTRREVIGSGLASTAAVAIAGVAAARTAPAAAVAGSVPPDLSFLRTESLHDADRARFFMARDGLDAIVVSRPPNVFYLTNHWPQLDRMGFIASSIAILPRDPARPVALVMHAFVYYYTHSLERDDPARLVFPYSAPSGPPAAAEAEPPATPPSLLRVLDPALVSEREASRRQRAAAMQPVSADATWALAKAVRALGLERATLGTDDGAIAVALGARGIVARCVDGENTLRWMRLAKTPAEIRLMRIAAQNNVDAAVAAVRDARAAGSMRALRQRFFAEAAARGNTGVFMVIDTSSTEMVDGPIRDGMAFSIDCVSACRNYHGDFARTVFVGEPPAEVRRATSAIFTAWGEIRSQLRAGMRFADVQRIGRESIRKQGVPFTVSFTPHSVGLFHTDHPNPNLLGGRPPESLVLEENTILSVDCPVLNAGFGGSCHFEDLTLIRRDGGEPIHSVPPNVLEV